MKKYAILGTLLVASIVALSTMGQVSAYSKVGTVTGGEGETLDKVSVNAEIVKIDGGEITFKDLDTGKEYTAGIGPSWYVGDVKVGDKVTIVGVVTTGDNDQDHSFKVMTYKDKVLRENYTGRPAWAGKGGNGQGAHDGTGEHRGHGNGEGGHGENFVDANNNGVCDYAE